MPEIKVNNLIFKSVQHISCMGKLYAFVKCIDKQANGKGKKEKRYWGEIAKHNDPSGIEQVMGYGAKWDKLPITE